MQYQFLLRKLPFSYLVPGIHFYIENETSHPLYDEGLNILNEFIASNIYRNALIGFTILEKMKHKVLMLG